MPGSRRAFLRTLSLGGAALGSACAARGPAATGPALAPASPAGPAPAGPIQIGSNENPFGPGEAVLKAIERALARVNRYPFRQAGALRERVAAYAGVPSSHVTLSSGSTEILHAAVTAFTAPGRGLLTGWPTFEEPVERARRLGVPVERIPLDASFRFDLEAMAAKASAAGLVYVCNPNNPTGTIVPAAVLAAFAERLSQSAPEATILVDEAYHEYVGGGDDGTLVPVALANPRVVVSRTFSKIFGMAGLRVGYAIGQPGTVRQIARHLGDLTMSGVAAEAAMAALGVADRVIEQRRINRETRALTAEAFGEAGCAVIPSEANFLMVDVKRDVRGFQAACYGQGVVVARPFPPLMTHARVTIGTPDEMKVAIAVFREILAGSEARRIPPLPRELARALARTC